MSYKIAIFNVFLKKDIKIILRLFCLARSVTRVVISCLARFARRSKEKESLLVVYSETKIRRKISKYGCPNCPYAGSWHNMLCSFGYSSLDVKKKKNILCKTL